MKKTSLLCLVFCLCLQYSYSQPGELDSSFGTNGIVKTDFGFLLKSTYPSYCMQVLLQPNVAMYAIIQQKDDDHFSFVSKRLLNGAPDSSYGNNSFSAPANLFATAAAQQADGKILVVGGKLNNEGKYVGAIVRYNTDGSLDDSFLEHAKEINIPGFASSVAIQSDGKILLAVPYGVLRYNSDGSRDSSFSSVEISKLFGFKSWASAVAIQKDGKIVVVGGGGERDQDFLIARFNINGSPDNSFSGDGKETTNFSYDDMATCVAIQPDGKIVVAGKGDHRIALARYNLDGSLDIQTSYNRSIEQQYDDYANAVATQSDGKIVVVGVSLIIRYNADGKLDNTFGKGQLYSPIGIASLVIQDGLKIVVGGGSFDLARYNNNGTLDKTFGSNGIEVGKLQFKQGSTFFTSTVIQSDGKIVAGGYTWTGKHYDFALARFNIDGSLDSTYDNDGRQITNFGSSFYGRTIAIQKDGKIVMAGDGKFPHTGLARYNTNGTPDITFNGDGKLDVTFKPNFNVASVAVQNDGKIILGGVSNNHFFLVRYNNDGNLDSSFSDDGIQTSSFGSGSDGVSSVAIQSDGKIIAAGAADALEDGYSFAIARYNPDGSLDNTFDGDGRITTKFGNESIARSVTVQKDGKIVVAGYADNGLGKSRDFGVVRYNTNGSLDNTFSDDGKQTTDFNSHVDQAESIAIQKDGKILLGGAATISISNYGNSYSGLARYNTDGRLDSTFNKTGKQTTALPGWGINGIAIAQDKLYAVGSGRFPHDLGVVVGYLLEDNIGSHPTVSLTTPTNNTTRLAPAAHIKLSAAAGDKDGTISKVEFYNGTTLLHTETIAPYGFVWRNVPLGNYTITAKAYDNSGNVTTSAAVHISVVPNKPPTVSITTPKNNQAFAAPGYIHFEANAKDIDGRITRVEFYNGSTLLRTEYKPPYTYVWRNVPRGKYTITAVATDNWGAYTVSAPVTIKVVLPPATIVSLKPSAVDNNPNVGNSVSLTLAPNPARGTVNISIKGLQRDKPATLSVLSASGVVMKTIQINTSATIIQLNVSSLSKGVYLVKIQSGPRIIVRQFVKL